jgi:hypothetical protein
MKKAVFMELMELFIVEGTVLSNNHTIELILTHLEKLKRYKPEKSSLISLALSEYRRDQKMQL